MSIIRSRFARVAVLAVVALWLVVRHRGASHEAAVSAASVASATSAPGIAPRPLATRAARAAVRGDSRDATAPHPDQLPAHLPDQRLGARTALASGFQRVRYSLAEYAAAYPQYPLPPDVQAQIAERAGGAITEVQGAAGEPIVAFANLAVACPVSVGPIVYPLSVRIDAHGHVVDAITLPVGRPVPPQLASCTFSPDASATTRTTFIPTGTVIAKQES